MHKNVIRVIASVLVGVLSVSLLTMATAAPPFAHSAAEPKENSPRATSPGHTLTIPGEDEPLTPPDPVHPRTALEQNRIEAAAWYMTGRLREARNDNAGAWDAYLQAVERDPNSVEIYRALVPLAFELGKNDEAIQFGIKAVELNPEDVDMPRRLAAVMASRDRVSEAIQLLQRAAEFTTVGKDSGAFVMLLRDLGFLYEFNRQFDKAADAYETVFDAMVHPDRFHFDVETRSNLMNNADKLYEKMGQAFLTANRPQQAKAVFEQAAAVGRGRPNRLSFFLAQVYLKTHEPQQALDELQKYFDAQLQSAGESAYVLLVEILRQLNRSDELLPMLESLAAKDKHNHPLQFFLAAQYLDADRLDDAAALYQKLLISAKDSRAYVGLAAVYRRQARPEDLLKALSQALKGQQGLEQLGPELEALVKDEKLLDGLIAVGRNLSQGEQPSLDFPASFVLAKLSGLAEKNQAAVEFYRYALTISGDRAPIVYEELGELLMLSKQYSEAEELYQQAADDPTASGVRANFLLSLSRAQEMNGKTASALETIAEVKRVVPGNPFLHYLEAWIHYHSRDWEQASQLFLQVIEKFPDQQRIVRLCQFSLSSIYVQQGDIKKGEEVLETIFAEEPDNPSVNNDLGYLYADQGKNLEQAQQMISKAIAAEPENPAYLDSMGWVLYKLGKFEEALVSMKKAVDMPQGQDATIWDHLGDCYKQLGRITDAKGAWQKALELGKSDHGTDEKLLQRLEQKLNDSDTGANRLNPQRLNSP